MNPIAPAGFRLGEIVNRFRSGQSGKARRAKAGGLIRRPIRIRGAAAVESCDVRRRASRHHGILGRARQRRTEEQCKACRVWRSQSALPPGSLLNRNISAAADLWSVVCLWSRMGRVQLGSRTSPQSSRLRPSVSSIGRMGRGVQCAGQPASAVF
jgi:hypothetical protein